MNRPVIIFSIFMLSIFAILPCSFASCDKVLGQRPLFDSITSELTTLSLNQDLEIVRASANLAAAKIIVLGQPHPRMRRSTDTDDQYWSVLASGARGRNVQSEFMAKYVKPGDIVFVEANYGDETLNIENYLVGKNQVSIKGWDHPGLRMLQRYADQQFVSTNKTLYLDLLDLLTEHRTAFLAKVLEETIAHLQGDQRVFVLAGSKHADDITDTLQKTLEATYVPFAILSQPGIARRRNVSEDDFRMLAQGKLNFLLSRMYRALPDQFQIPEFKFDPL